MVYERNVADRATAERRDTPGDTKRVAVRFGRATVQVRTGAHLCTYKSSAACEPVRFGAEAPWRRAAGAVADPSVVGDAAAGTSGRSEPRRCRKFPCTFLTESFTLDVALRTSSSTLAESAVENERMRSSALNGRNGSEAAPAHASGANTCVRAC